MNANILREVMKTCDFYEEDTNKMRLNEPFNILRSYCETENYKGWDPYDGLNSRVFQALPLLKKSAVCRLAMIQAFKRCPINLRRLFLVSKEHNAKGIGLFLQGYCNLYRIVEGQRTKVEGLMSKEEILGKIIYLADLLLEMRSDKIFTNQYHGACWGYNFDWQARRLFLFPKHTPTVVGNEFLCLGKPVLVMRNTTERPEALSAGTVKLVGTDHDLIIAEVSKLLEDMDYYDKMSRTVNPYGDGLACSRIVNAIK